VSLLWGKWGTSILAGAALLAAGAPMVQAQDAGFRFGPVGEGPATYNSGYDRTFIREWQQNPPKGFPTLSKANLGPTKAAITRYEEILANGGFLAIPEVELEPGATDPTVATLRKRLAASGDLADADSSYPDYFGSELDTAVKRFQASNGLAPTGIVDKRTVAALNIALRPDGSYVDRAMGHGAVGGVGGEAEAGELPVGGDAPLHDRVEDFDAVVLTAGALEAVADAIGIGAHVVQEGGSLAVPGGPD